MIHDELVTYEVAMLARYRGFNVATEMYYHIYSDKEDSQASLESTGYGRVFYNSTNTYRCSAPTQSLLQRWLREEKGVEVYVRHFEETNKYPHHFGTIITDDKGETLKIGGKMFDSYELALEDALKYALENLV